VNQLSEILGEKGHHVLEIEAVKQMVEANVGSLLVTEGGKVTGIVTERDYLRRVTLHGRHPVACEDADHPDRLQVSRAAPAPSVRGLPPRRHRPACRRMQEARHGRCRLSLYRSGIGRSGVRVYTGMRGPYSGADA